MAKREKELSDARMYILGLLIDCPYELNPKDCNCNLHDMRKKPLKERIDWSKQLTDQQGQNIISSHKKCLAQRETNNNVANE